MVPIVVSLKDCCCLETSKMVMGGLMAWVSEMSMKPDGCVLKAEEHCGQNQMTGGRSTMLLPVDPSRVLSILHTNFPSWTHSRGIPYRAAHTATYSTLGSWSSTLLNRGTLSASTLSPSFSGSGYLILLQLPLFTLPTLHVPASPASLKNS